MKKYQIIYADPAWSYKNQTQHAGKGKPNTGGAKTHYPTMSIKDMKKLKVPSLCSDDCLIFMWSSSPHLDVAIELMKAWGFNWATIGFVWDKQRVNPSFYTMSQIEICLIGKKKGGKIPQPRGARNVRQFLSKMRGKHSEKPKEVRKRIEQMFPTQNKIELFARERVENWDAWGNEVESDVEI
tara:strand:+ start:3527 stop:4075 length:549 start_codon:yes stop_codon:yes gene_type:complete